MNSDMCAIISVLKDGGYDVVTIGRECSGVYCVRVQRADNTDGYKVACDIANMKKFGDCIEED